MAATAHLFESAQSAQTLAEALQEYYASNPGLMRGEQLSAEAQEFFHAHDVVHVLYGCGTSMPDEAIVKLSSILGTTGGLSVLRGYRLHESIDIYRQLPLAGTLAALVSAPLLISRTLWRCRQQRQKWPWADHQQYMATPLYELRRHFGIKVARASRASAA
jgi:hypothetical protein